MRSCSGNWHSVLPLEFQFSFFIHNRTSEHDRNIDAGFNFFLESVMRLL